MHRLVIGLLISLSSDGVALKLPVTSAGQPASRSSLAAAAPIVSEAASMASKLLDDAPVAAPAVAAETTLPKDPSIKPIINKAAYDALVASAQAEDRIVVIKLYAQKCRSCMALAPKFLSVANKWSGKDVEFYSLLFDTNKALFRKLGVKTLPVMEIVTSDMVDQFPCGPAKMPKLVERIEAAVERKKSAT